MRGAVVQKPAKTGRWYVVIDLGRDGSGKRKRQWHSGYRSQREAERGLTQLMSAKDTGTYVPPQRMRVGEYLLERWLPAIEQTIRPTTYSGYTRHIQRYVVPRIGALLLQDLTPDRLSVLYRDLVAGGGVNGRPLAPNTLRRIHASLHRAFRDAVSWGYMLRNPAAVASKPKAPSPGSAKMRIWTAAELRRFLEHVAEDRLFGAWRLAASTGMRRSEILGLRWIDVDFDASQLAVRQTYTNAGAATMFGEPKTSRSKRTVALDVETARAMRSWRTKQLEERLLWADAWEDCGLVFTRENGAAIHPDAFSARWGKVRDASGLPPIRFHDLAPGHCVGLASWVTTAKELLDG